MNTNVDLFSLPPLLSCHYTIDILSGYRAPGVVYSSGGAVAPNDTTSLPVTPITLAVDPPSSLIWAIIYLLHLLFTVTQMVFTVRGGHLSVYVTDTTRLLLVVAFVLNTLGVPLQDRSMHLAAIVVRFFFLGFMLLAYISSSVRYGLYRDEIHLTQYELWASSSMIKQVH